MTCLSSEQQRALIYKPGLNVTVTAGAGTGKTTLLTERFIHTLLHEEDGRFPNEIHHILAITFTEKAAGEVKNRIYKKIDTMLLQEQNMGKKTHLKKAMDNFHKAQISTIHSFCASLLRENPVEAGIDPTFSIIDDTQQLMMLKESIQKVLENLIYFPASNSPLKNLLSLWSIYRIKKNIMFLLSSRSKYFQLRELIHKIPSEVLLAKIKNALKSITKENILRMGLPEKVDALKGLCLAKLKSANPKDRAKAETLLNEYIKTAHYCFSDLYNLHEKREELKFLLSYEQTKSGFKIPAEFSPAAIKKYLKNSGANIFTNDTRLDTAALENIKSLISIADQVYEIFQKNKTSHNVLDFEDLLLRCHAFLSGLKNASDALSLKILKRLQSQYRFILVDEFQDTDALQWEIIKLLATKNGALQNLFLVGDEKQSIYSFRGGDVTVFANAKQEMSGRGNFIDCSLKDNYRSVEPIIIFTNYLFGKLFGADDPQENPLSVTPQNLRCKRKNCGSEDTSTRINRGVEFLIAHTDLKHIETTNSMSPYEIEACLIAKKIDAIIKGTDLNKGFLHIKQKIDRGECAIGILFRRSTHIKVYEEALRQRGIDFVVNRGTGFFARQEILDIINLLDFLNDPRKDISLVGVLRSPFFCVKDYSLLKIRRLAKTSFFEILQSVYHHIHSCPEQHLSRALQHDPSLEQLFPNLVSIYKQLNSWLYLKDRLRLSEFIRHILFESQFSIALCRGVRGKQAQANVEKFIQIARDFEMGGTRSLSEFLQYLEQQIESTVRQPEGIEDTIHGSSVQLMTIHAAKGLQFPMVILPDLHADFHFSENILFKKVRNSLLEFKPSSGFTALLGFKVPDHENKMEPSDTMIHSVINFESRMQVRTEEKRLFFVACTRAEDNLCLVLRSGEMVFQDAEKVNECKNYAAWLSCIFPELENIVKQGRPHSFLNINAEKSIKIPVVLHSPDAPYLSSENHIEKVLKKWDTIVKKESGTHSNISAFLNPLPDSSVPIVTPTGLSLFAKCPKQYYYTYILGISESSFLFSNKWSQPKILEIANMMITKEAALIRGSVIHEVLGKDLLFKENSIEEGLLSDDLKKVIDAMIDRQLEHANNAIQHELMQCKYIISEQVYKGLYNFIRDRVFFPKLLSIYKNNSVQNFSEAPFELLLEHCILKGTIDKLYFDEDEKGWVILDYKTHLLQRQSKQMIADTYHYQWQLVCYHFAAEKILGQGSVKKLFLYFTDSPGEPVLTFSVEGLSNFHMHNMNFTQFEDVLRYLSLCIHEGEKAFFSRKPAICSENCVYKIYNICKQM